MFHHHPSFTAEGVAPAVVELVLCGASSSTSMATNAVQGTITRAGTEHANFWPLWWADQRFANLSHANGDYTAWSAYSDAPPLASERARRVFAQGLRRYQSAAMLAPHRLTGATSSNGCMRVQLDLPTHEVALVEIVDHGLEAV